MFPPYYANADTIIKKILRRILEKIYLIDPYSGWILPGIISGINLLWRKDIDKILVTGPPFSQFIIGYTLSKLFRKKLLIDYQDPWYLYLSLHGLKNNSLRYQLCLWIEKRILNHTDRIIFNTKLVKEEYCKLFSFIKDLEKKSFVIENAFIPANSLEPKSLGKNKKVIIYAGNFYGDRKINHIIIPLLQLEEKGIIKRDSVMIHVFGQIPDEDKDYISKYGLEKSIVIHSKVTTEEILKYLKGSDILYLPQGNDVKYSIPYKFFDYLSVKKPILAVTPAGSATAQIVEETGSGETADITDSKSIYNALKKILGNNIEYSFKSEKYTWENISLKYVEVLESL